MAAALAGAGLPLVVVNPAQVRAFAKALGKRAKTDPIDAAVIARFVAATKPAVRTLPRNAATQLLADLVGRRRQIVDMLAAERQRQSRLTARHLARGSLVRLIAALERELDAVDREIDYRDPRLARLARDAKISSARCPASAPSSPGP